MIIAVDFDGTCVAHEFPKIGKDIGAVPVLKELVAAGHKLVLFTMRHDREQNSPTPDGIEDVTGNFLSDAVNWFKENEIPLWGIQKNPEQHTWTGSNKAYAHVYIDDAALGCPLIHGQHERPYVDWEAVRKLLIHTGKS